MGAARQGGRFNRPDQEALYLSLDEATALAEYKQDNPWLRPGTICTFFANRLRVADLSAGRHCGPTSRWIGVRSGSASPSSRRLGIWPTTW
ncbi:RES family NAD+ phosphorylase [Metapseudomonas furukawaii]|uniref:RES family NAD+ phosphorylase n=1 Tax=Metapseudomonas furukawaii TaxID=1149133 RepID=UPI00227CE7EE|nr:RES family NAD+ phosphorylase [Pseudomonas furukawaii]